MSGAKAGALAVLVWGIVRLVWPLTAHILSLPPMDLAGHATLANAFYAAFPDLTHRIEHAFADDEHATVRYRLIGTHQGDLMGLAPTGKQVNVAGMMTVHIIDGKVKELFGIIDQMALMQQVGAVAS